MQVEALLEYNQQAKNIEVQEQSLQKLKGTLDQKQSSLEAEETRQRHSEELLRKEQAEWKEVNTKRQAVLEAELQSKLTEFADKEPEYVQKWDALEESKRAFTDDQEAKNRQMEQLKQEADQQYLQVQKTKREVQDKERRLDEERKTVRLDKESSQLKHTNELMQVRRSELTKLFVASSVCFILGLAMAMFLFSSGDAGDVTEATDMNNGE